MKPQIISLDTGVHNADLEKSRDRLLKGQSYRDCSTIMVVPSINGIHARVVASWFNLIPAMNQKLLRIWPTGMEVGDAYSQTVDMILANDGLASFKYMLTVEVDNIPPPDGVVRLLEAIDGGVDGNKWDAVGGLYWTKGEGGQPMIYGDPTVMPRNFMPQVPIPDAIQPCNGLGMGFTLFRLEMFKDPKLPRPFFKTVGEYLPGQGSKVYTQDLYFFENALGLGYKFACDTRVKVGHWDANTDIVW